jgi:hypothetical protein
MLFNLMITEQFDSHTLDDSENENTRLFLSCRHIILCCSCTNGLLVSLEKKLFNQNALIFLLVSFSKYFVVHFSNFSGVRIYLKSEYFLLFFKIRYFLFLLKFYTVKIEDFFKEKIPWYNLGSKNFSFSSFGGIRKPTVDSVNNKIWPFARFFFPETRYTHGVI